ncbi:SHOCT domain-containing protein [Methanosarcina sp. KYL-1]|nr:SHOCT domain-containing protein [Methanosarcina sp. KYL-1]
MSAIGSSGIGGGNYFLLVLVWLIIIVCTIAVVKLSLQKDKPPEEEKSELELANSRYEKGEITEEELEEIKKRLS